MLLMGIYPAEISSSKLTAVHFYCHVIATLWIFQGWFDSGRLLQRRHGCCTSGFLHLGR
ncbi:unnamed protein product [Acidithrix sp. C25]|nr:unnamed protein product [Acidithrix sp. C25]